MTWVVDALDTRCPEGHWRYHIRVQRPRKPLTRDFGSVQNIFVRKLLEETWVVDVLGTKCIGGPRRCHICVERPRNPNGTNALIIVEVNNFYTYLLEECTSENARKKNGQSFQMSSWIECTLNHKDRAVTMGGIGGTPPPPRKVGNEKSAFWPNNYQLTFIFENKMKNFI